MNPLKLNEFEKKEVNFNIESELNTEMRKIVDDAVAVDDDDLLSKLDNIDKMDSSDEDKDNNNNNNNKKTSNKLVIKVSEMKLLKLIFG